MTSFCLPRVKFSPTFKLSQQIQAMEEYKRLPAGEVDPEE